MLKKIKITVNWICIVPIILLIDLCFYVLGIFSEYFRDLYFFTQIRKVEKIMEMEEE